MGHLRLRADCIRSPAASASLPCLAFVELTTELLDAITPIRVEDMTRGGTSAAWFHRNFGEKWRSPLIVSRHGYLRGGQITVKYLPKCWADAGEHYALSQFTLAGFPASKMPENWEGYDLAVESGKGLLRVSAQTKEWPQMEKGNWFVFDDRKHCDWIVFIFVDLDNSIRAWVVPLCGWPNPTPTSQARSAKIPGFATYPSRS